MSNYPLGAEFDSSAPYNQSDESDNVIDVQVVCSNTLSKDFVLTTDQCDSEGNLSDDCNLTEEFYNQQYSAKQALDLAANFAKEIYTTLNNKEHSGLIAAAIDVFNACEGWNEDELEVVID